jgi:Protein of unknown function (DUF4238)
MRRKSNSRSRPKHQHWVPQFYLRYFSTPATRDSDKPQIWMFSKDPTDGDEKLTSVRNVCGMRYLYSPRLPNGERTWELDDKLNDVEALLGRIWPALATDFVDLDDEHIRKAIALFVAVMHFRHPANRRDVEETHKQLISLYQSLPQRQDGTPNVASIEVKGKTYELDTADWHNYKAWAKDDHDRFFVEFVQSEVGSMAAHLLGKRWSVVFSEADTFITTDKPVVLQHQTRERFGYGTEGTILSFPLSPTRLLVMDDLHQEPTNQYYPLVESNVGAFNCTVWRGASRFLLTGRSLEEVLTEICECADRFDDLTVIS